VERFECLSQIFAANVFFLRRIFVTEISATMEIRSRVNIAAEIIAEVLVLVNLNGWPGVGKLTTARELKKLLGGKLLDNHTILNVGKALAEGGTPEYYHLVRAVRASAFAAILELPSTVPIILTNVVARGGASGFLEENWQALINLAQARDCPLFSVTLTCSAIENARRIIRDDRGLLRKKQDPELLTELARTRSLYDDGATFRTVIDNTELSPLETARRIQEWIKDVSPTSHGTNY
jgi:shikimate kinase